MDKQPEKYFLGSDFDEPLELFFSKRSAFASDHSYIDTFDKDGKKVDAFRLDEETGKYTDDF